MTTTTALIEKICPVPDDCRVSLKKISVSRAMSEETTAFTADVYFDGVCMGAVVNHGTGGCNMYHGRENHWYVREGDPVYDYAANWQMLYGHEDGETPRVFEPLDALIDAIVQERDYAKDVRKFAKEGCTHIAIVQGGRRTYPIHETMGSGTMVYYEQQATVAMRVPERVGDRTATDEQRQQVFVGKLADDGWQTYRMLMPL